MVQALKIFKVSCDLGVRGPASSEIFKELLIASGIDPALIVERFEKGRSGVDIYNIDPQSAARARQLVRSFKLRKVRTQSHEVKPEDWAEKWKKGVKPFKLTKNIVVIPRWSKPSKADPKGCAPIYIDTNLAFGTGLHETTRFMAELIEEQGGRFFSFLDVGTGTGILAIVAARCGAKRIAAFDIDPAAVKVAAENWEANGLANAQLFCQDLGKWRSRAAYDYVAANLVSGDLIKFARILLRRVRAGGYLAVSGISLKKLSSVRKTFRALPLREIGTKRGREWAAILYQKV